MRVRDSHNRIRTFSHESSGLGFAWKRFHRFTPFEHIKCTLHRYALILPIFLAACALRRNSALFLLVEVYLDLSMNLFGGKVPEALYDLSVLRKLDVSVNQITGVLGSGLGKLGGLTELNVRSNLITGTVSINEIPRADPYAHVTIALAWSAGIIPDTFDLLPDLAVISLDNNLLTGNIPEFSGVFVQHRKSRSSSCFNPGDEWLRFTHYSLPSYRGSDSFTQSFVWINTRASPGRTARSWGCVQV